LLLDVLIATHWCILIFTQNFKPQIPWVIYLLAACYDVALKQEVVLYSADHRNKAAGHNLQ
jgi:hypothetical protein